MSLTSNTTSTPSNFEAIFNAALIEYTKQTGKDLRGHPFASKIDSCDNPDSIIAIFEEQAKQFNEFRNGDIKLFKWFKPVITVLHTLSTNETLSGIASHVSPATLVIFILTLYLQGISPGKGGLLWHRHPSLREYFPHYLRPNPCSHSKPPDGQGCKRKLRRISRYLRMYREFPQTTQYL